MKRLVLAGAAAALLCSAAFEIRAQETAPPTATAPRSGLGDRITNLRARLWGDKNGAPPSGAATATPPGAPAASEEAAPGALAPPAGSPYAGTAPATGGGIERLPADGSAPPLPASARANPNGQGYTGQGGVPPRMAAVPEPGSSRRRPDSDPAVSPELKALDDQPRQPFTPPTSGVRPGYQAPAFSTAPPSGSPASSAPAAVSADRESSNANAPGEASVSSDAGPATPPAPFRSHPGLTPLPPTGMTPPAASPFAQPAPSTASPPAATTAPLAASSNSAAPPNSAATAATAASAGTPATASLSPNPAISRTPLTTAPMSPPPGYAAPDAPATPNYSTTTTPSAPAYAPGSTSPANLGSSSGVGAPSGSAASSGGASVNRSRLAAEMERLQQRLPPAEETPPATATRTNEDGSPFSGADETTTAEDGAAALRSLEESAAPAMESSEDAPALQPAPAGEGLGNPYREPADEAASEVAPLETSGDEIAPQYETPVRPEAPRARLGSVGGAASPAGTGRVLSSRQTPILVVDTVGPSRIVIGKEATYSVVLRNSGNSAAKDVVVAVKVPDWAQIVGCEAKASGFVSRGAGDRNDQVNWTIGRVEPQQQEELLVRVLPKQGLPFELSVSVSHSPVASQASVEVAEPKLTMALSGPSEVLFGKQELFRLVLSNPGTADAENVQLRLYAANPGEAPPPAHEVGTVPAGDKKVIELELTAREGGTLKIHATATASGGLTAEANEAVLVRKPDLRIAAQGPKFRYSGTPGLYEIVVANPGNADARNVQVVALVPPGAKYVECSDRGQYDAERGKVTWKLNSLAAGGETVLSWKCELGEAGQTRFQAACVADGGLKDSTSTITQVEAIADLVVAVFDPRGPIPVGEEMTYQIKISNRGTRRADNVAVAGYFPTGLKGVASNEGHGYRVSQGFVQFDPLASVAPGQEIVLSVKAVATTPGNHVFKAELRCEALNTRIAVEENTMFYSDDEGGPSHSAPVAAEAAAAPRGEERAASAAPVPPRTAGRLKLN